MYIYRNYSYKEYRARFLVIVRDIYIVAVDIIVVINIVNIIDIININPLPPK